MKGRIKNIIFLLLLFTLIFQIACGSKVDNIEDEIIGNNKIEEEVEKVEEVKYSSPLSGIEGNIEVIKRRPVAIMFDNHNKARWQAGLKDAELVYEIPVEYPYTRYMGVYLLNEPENVGSVRSARPYFIEKAIENDAIYVRVGGSEQAKKDIIHYGLDDLDGLKNMPNVFQRKSHKKAPHNLYTNMKAIREKAAENNFREDSYVEGFKFNTNEEIPKGDVAKDVVIRYNKDNTTRYIYDENKKTYAREKDGTLHIDENNEEPIEVTNIIIQRTIIRTIDNEGRLGIDLIGTGKGLYISKGFSEEITWKKDAQGMRTIFYNSLGEEININPGQTWIQIVNIDTEVDIPIGG